jgi:DNA-binding NtrC family response regulator
METKVGRIGDWPHGPGSHGPGGHPAISKWYRFDPPLNPAPLCTRESLDAEAMWQYLQRLLDRVYGVADSDSLIDDCLDILVELLGADRGLILQTASDGSSRVIHARAQKKTLSPDEWEEVSRTVVREALESGRCVTWDPLATRGSASAALLGIHIALAAPLGHFSRGGPRGVLYVDFRDIRKFVGTQHSAFFRSAATVLGAVLEQNERGLLARDHLREARQHCVDVRPATPLSDLLAPASMQAIRRELESALASNTPILIVGESGTGKTLLAQAIAEASERRPIVRAVLGSSDDLNTITSELFGHERGAYSGAAFRRIGLVEYAHGGTLLLDEILNLTSHAQQLLLDFTQFGTYRPLGYDRPDPKRANVRIVASTNGNLLAAVREGRFRQDLYYRLAGVTLEIPPLRQRREEAPGLAESTLCRVDPKRTWGLSLALRRLLVSPSFEWSGNIRQLERAVERARERAVARDPEACVLTPEHFEARDLGATSLEGNELRGPEDPLGSSWQKLQGERARIDEREQEVIRRALQESGGVVAQAARALGIARTTLASRIEALGLRSAKRGEP